MGVETEDIHISPEESEEILSVSLSLCGLILLIYFVIRILLRKLV